MKTYLVKVFNQTFNTSQNTFCKTEKDPIILRPGRVGHSSESLNDGNQQGPETDGSKTGRQGSLETVKNRGRAKRVGLLGSDPPGCNYSSYSDVDSILKIHVEQGTC